MTLPILGMGELAASSSSLGNKVRNLANLGQTGIRIPQGFGLPYAAYAHHVAELLPALGRARTQSATYSHMAKQLQDIIVSSPFAYERDVLAALEIHLPRAPYFAVRSSGAPVVKGETLAEDSATVSMAGQYESFLLVPADKVPLAVLWCFASLFSERCLEQFSVREDASYLASQMSVLVQEMCIADLSAVVMTRDPVEGGDTFGMEVTYGACEGLVSGTVQGDLHLLSRATGTLLDTEIGTKAVRYSYEPLLDPATPNKITTSVPQTEQDRQAATFDQIRAIYDLGMRAERHFGTPQDLELVIAGEEIIVTQTRPVTASK